MKYCTEKKNQLTEFVRILEIKPEEHGLKSQQMLMAAIALAAREVLVQKQIAIETKTLNWQEVITALANTPLQTMAYEIPGEKIDSSLLKTRFGFKNMGELAGAYEEHLGTAADKKQKNQGSFYTPVELCEMLTEEVLSPLIDRALSGKKSLKSILSLRICDPACGTGNFLIEAGDRILAAAKTIDPECRWPDVIQCLHGVDLDRLLRQQGRSLCMFQEDNPLVLRLYCIACSSQCHCILLRNQH